MKILFYIGIFLGLCVLGVVLGLFLFSFTGCQTPYGTLSGDAIDDYIRDSDDGLVCLSDGFDSVCIKTIPGRRGKPGRDGKDGAIVTLEVERIVTETVIETVREVFILHVMRTEMTYQTPLGAVYVPEDAPVVAPEGVKVTPVVEGRDSEIPPTVKSRDSEIPPTGRDGTVEGRDSEIPPTGRDSTVEGRDSEIPATEGVEGNEIWHMMYRNDGGAVAVYVYPRCFNNPYHNPPRPVCSEASDIDENVFFAVSEDFDIEMQGDRASVQYLLNQALEADGAGLVSVGGIQGIVN